jgi:hypothetical protein
MNRNDAEIELPRKDTFPSILYMTNTSHHPQVSINPPVGAQIPNIQAPI